MTSIQARLKVLRAEFLTVCDNVYHYRRPERAKPPFIIWCEDGEGETSFSADDRKAEQSIHGYVDYFTSKEFDPVVDQVQEVLNLNRAEWRLTDVQYEEETNLIHFAWEWTI